MDSMKCGRYKKNVWKMWERCCGIYAQPLSMPLDTRQISKTEIYLPHIWKRLFVQCPPFFVFVLNLFVVFGLEALILMMLCPVLSMFYCSLVSLALEAGVNTGDGNQLCFQRYTRPASCH